MSNSFVYNPVTGQLDLVNDGSGGGSGAVNSVNGQTGNVVLNITNVTQRKVLNASDISNKYITLGHVPIDATSVQLTIIGGPDQDYGTDYIVSGTQLSWVGLGLDGILTTNDVLKIVYTY